MPFSKAYFPTIIFLFTAFFLFGQEAKLKPLVTKTTHKQTDWFLEMQSSRPNWFKVEALNRAYFKAHPYEKSQERRHCERWLQVMRPYLDTEGYVQMPSVPKETFLPQKPILSARSAGNDMTGSWRMIGPSQEEKSCNGTGSAPMPGGYCDRVYINPYNTNNLYSAQSYGGMWVSKDRGATWKLTDAEFANGTNTYANRDYYYGEIEANKLNSGLVYAATEAGLLKSTTGGDAWAMCPQLNRAATSTLRPYFVAQANDDQTTVLSTFGKKLFRSTDAGQTWAKAFDNTNGGASRTGSNQHSFQPFGLYDRTYNFWGLASHPSNNNVFYLGVMNANDETCIYKSTDKGVSFSLLVNLNQKLGKAIVKAVQMKTIPIAPNKILIYGLFDKESIYKFGENGDLLETIPNPISYYEGFDIDWLDENKVYNSYYSLDYIYKSKDAGRSFAITQGNCNINVHSDPRGISAVGDMVLVGTDGGIYLSTDGGVTYPSVGDDISAIDLWGFSSSFKSDIVLVGCDHGPNMLRTVDALQSWKRVLGADAGASTINPANDNWMYLDWGYGKSKGELQANGTLTLSPTTTDIDFQRIEFNPILWTTSYGIAGNQVRISTDNLTTNSLFFDFGVPVNQFKVALKDTNTMYVLLQNKTLKKSLDAGKTWSDITPTLAVSKNQTNIVNFEIGKLPAEIWVAYGNLQNACKLLKSGNNGANWTDLTTNLPTAPIQHITFQRGTEGGLYVAMQGNGGVWYRNNALADWKQIGQGLPMLGYIRQAYTVPAKNKFRMGSSRGAFEHELYEASNLDAHFSANTRTVSCKDVVSFRDVSAYSKTSGAKFSWTFPGGNPSTSTEENPKVSYAIAAGAKYDVSLTITDAAGKSSSYSVKNFVEVIVSNNCQNSPIAGKAFNLSGADGGASLPPLPIKQLPFTMTAWVKPTVLQKSFSQIIGQSGAPRAANLPHFSFGFAFKSYTANNNLVFTAKDVNYGITSSLDLPTDKWSHVAIVVEAAKTTIYLDGNPWVYTGAIPAPDFEQYPLLINADIHGQSGNFKGILDEIAIYNTALTQDVIRETMHLTKTGLETNLVAYYQFNQYANNKVYETKNGYDLTNIGSSLILPVSTAPVASGASKRLAGNSTVLDFAGTNLSAQLTNISGNEFVAYRLDAAPNFAPNANANIKKYWILRSWGAETNAANKISNLTFTNSGLKPTTAQLFTRSANEDVNIWSNSGSVPSGNIAFSTTNKISDNSQIALIGDVSTPILEINGQTIKVTAFPNPTNDKLELTFQPTEKAANVQLILTNLLGQNLQEKSLKLGLSTSQMSFDLSSYADGLYIISVQFEGRIVYNLQVAKVK